jgi:hypothetical protein
MGDQRLVVGVLSSHGCDLGASRDQRHFQRFDIVWQSFKAVVH